MKKILILAGRYLPGHKDGGPLRTLVNLTDALGDEYDFYIACYDRDHGDNMPYNGIKYDTWNNVGKAKVWYVPEGQFKKKTILELSEGKDVVYATSIYEQYGFDTLLLKRIGKLKQPVYIASMGVFAEEALRKSALKKKVYIFMCKLLGLFKKITWSVSSGFEAKDVKRVIGRKIDYVIAEDLPRITVPGRLREYNDSLKIIFLARICEHKNLKVAIDAIEAMNKRKDIEFEIYGPIQEEEYWNKCLEKLENAHFKWNYGGDVPSENVQDVLSRSDVLILPSKSENYGHVIFEALSVGVIPVISDRTPWKELNQEGIGYEIPLSTKAFTEKLDELVKMSADNRGKMAEKGILYAQKKVRESIENTRYREIFG